MNYPHDLEPLSRHTNPPPFWRTRYGVGLLVLVAIAAYFLVTEHLAHVVGVLPLLILFACPLMHVFMHHGLGRHHPESQERNVDVGKPAQSKPGDTS